MMDSPYTFVGKITRKYSFKGEVLARIEDFALEVFISNKAFFVDLNGNFVPFEIASLRPHKRGFLRLKIEGISGEKATEPILRKEIYLPNHLTFSEENELFPHEMIGMTVIDKASGNIGTIAYADTSTPQTLLAVSHNQKDILIPFVESFIIDIDKDKKQLLMQLPEGLLNINE